MKERLLLKPVIMHVHEYTIFILSKREKKGINLPPVPKTKKEKKEEKYKKPNQTEDSPQPHHPLVMVLPMSPLIRRLRNLLINHTIHLPRLSALAQQRTLLLAPLGLLALLDHIAGRAAAGAHAVFAAVALEVVLGAHVGAREPGQNEAEAAGYERAGAHAGAVAARVRRHVAVFFDAVAGFAVQDAGAPPCHAA